MIYGILFAILLFSLVSETVRMLVFCPRQLKNYQFLKDNIDKFSIDKSASTCDVLFFTWKANNYLYVIAIRKHNSSCIAFESNTGELLIDDRWTSHWVKLLENLEWGV